MQSGLAVWPFIILLTVSVNAHATIHTCARFLHIADIHKLEYVTRLV